MYTISYHAHYVFSHKHTCNSVNAHVNLQNINAKHLRIKYYEHFLHIQYIHTVFHDIMPLYIYIQTYTYIYIIIYPSSGDVLVHQSKVIIS